MESGAEVKKEVWKEEVETRVSCVSISPHCRILGGEGASDSFNGIPDDVETTGVDVC
jgi:hypothetical protein